RVPGVRPPLHHVRAHRRKHALGGEEGWHARTLRPPEGNGGAAARLREAPHRRRADRGDRHPGRASLPGEGGGGDPLHLDRGDHLGEAPTAGRRGLRPLRLRLPRFREHRRIPRGALRATGKEEVMREEFMRLALEEAQKGLGSTSPNPPVGAVIVRDGEVVGRGHHERAGGPHAEKVALEAAGEAARGADLYVTLEPCDHEGRTPPCAPAVAAAGIRRVFIGPIDPNPKVSGRGVARLRSAGVEVEVGVAGAECRRLIEPWEKFIRTKRPFVTAKVAATLDGRIATRTGASKWITGEPARAEVHALRSVVDAILVGAGTVRADDPALT